jgi:hypothetical protein
MQNSPLITKIGISQMTCMNSPKMGVTTDIKVAVAFFRYDSGTRVEIIQKIRYTLQIRVSGQGTRNMSTKLKSRNCCVQAGYTEATGRRPMDALASSLLQALQRISPIPLQSVVTVHTDTRRGKNCQRQVLRLVDMPQEAAEV